MSRRAMLQSDYDKMLAFYREQPGRPALCAARTGLSPKTAKKAWEVGWPERGWPAMRGLLEGEIMEARTRAAKAAADASEARRVAGLPSATAQVREDAVNTRVEEARNIRIARSNASGILAVTNKLLVGLGRLAEALQVQIVAAVSKGEPVEWGQAGLLISRIATAVRQGAEAAQTTMEMERLWLGEPTEVIGVRAIDPNTPVSEVLARIEAARSAIDRAKARGMVVLPGGAPAEGKSSGG